MAFFFLHLPLAWIARANCLGYLTLKTRWSAGPWRRAGSAFLCEGGAALFGSEQYAKSVVRAVPTGYGSSKMKRGLAAMLGHRLTTLGLLFKVLGMPGTVRVAMAKLAGAERVVVTAKGIEMPILLRMNNCDLPLLAEILCTSYCELALPWQPRTILDLGANIGLTAIKL